MTFNETYEVIRILQGNGAFVQAQMHNGYALVAPHSFRRLGKSYIPYITLPLKVLSLRGCATSFNKDEQKAVFAWYDGEWDVILKIKNGEITYQWKNTLNEGKYLNNEVSISYNEFTNEGGLTIVDRHIPDTIFWKNDLVDEFAFYFFEKMKEIYLKDFGRNV